MSVYKYWQWSIKWNPAYMFSQWQWRYIEKREIEWKIECERGRDWKRVADDIWFYAPFWVEYTTWGIQQQYNVCSNDVEVRRLYAAWQCDKKRWNGALLRMKRLSSTMASEQLKHRVNSAKQTSPSLTACPHNPSMCSVLSSPLLFSRTIALAPPNVAWLS